MKRLNVCMAATAAVIAFAAAQFEAAATVKPGGDATSRPGPRIPKSGLLKGGVKIPNAGCPEGFKEGPAIGTMPTMPTKYMCISRTVYPRCNRQHHVVDGQPQVMRTGQGWSMIYHCKPVFG